MIMTMMVMMKIRGKKTWKQWCIDKNRGGYTLETRRRYMPVYAVLL